MKLVFSASADTPNAGGSYTEYELEVKVSRTAGRAGGFRTWKIESARLNVLDGRHISLAYTFERSRFRCTCGTYRTYHSLVQDCVSALWASITSIGNAAQRGEPRWTSDPRYFASGSRWFRSRVLTPMVRYLPVDANRDLDTTYICTGEFSVVRFHENVQLTLYVGGGYRAGLLTEEEAAPWHQQLHRAALLPVPRYGNRYLIDLQNIPAPVRESRRWLRSLLSPRMNPYLNAGVEPQTRWTGLPFTNFVRRVSDPISSRQAGARGTAASGPAQQDRVFSYSYKPVPQFYGAPSTRMFFGVELEVDVNTNPINTNTTIARCAREALGAKAYVKSDGSLNYGAEIVTHPLSFDKWVEIRPEVDALMRQLVALGWRGHDADKAGLHVHISRTAFDTPEHLYRFLHLIYRSPSFSLRVSQRVKSKLDQWASLSQNDRKRLKTKAGLASGAPDSRYTAVNVTTATVEVRIFRSTLNVSRFYKALQFLHAAVEFTRQATLRNSHAEKFVAWVKGTEERVALYADLLEFLSLNTRWVAASRADRRSRRPQADASVNDRAPADAAPADAVTASTADPNGTIERVFRDLFHDHRDTPLGSV